jgi:hypothetical protein
VSIREDSKDRRRHTFVDEQVHRAVFVRKLAGDLMYQLALVSSINVRGSKTQKLANDCVGRESGYMQPYISPRLVCLCQLCRAHSVPDIGSAQLSRFASVFASIHSGDVPLHASLRPA